MLAVAIENMDGIGGKPGWAFIFILVRFYNVFYDLFFFQSSNTFIGSIVCSSHRHPYLLRCPLNTTRFQIFIREPERVGLPSLYTAFHLLTLGSNRDYA